ncbi:Cro/CI family transcriptional regulator [Escherichia coli]|uniref:Cro/CI family transcriptional regulator n=1 Tax=Escherichia coli TaxID=562 RepID=UPI0039E1F17E
MKKSEVLGYFGGVVKTAAALGTSKTTVSMWGEEVPWKWALLIQAVTAGALKYELSGLTKKSVRSAVKSAVQLWSHLTGCSLWRKEKPDWQMM